MSDKAALKQLKFFLPANENASQPDVHIAQENLEALLNVEKASKALTRKDWLLLLEQLAQLKLTDAPSAKDLFALLNSRLPQSLERLILYMHLRVMHGTAFLTALQTFSPPKIVLYTLEIGQRCGTFSMACRLLAEHITKEKTLTSFTQLSFGICLSLAGIFLSAALACWQLSPTYSLVMGVLATGLSAPILCLWGSVNAISLITALLPSRSKMLCDRLLLRLPRYGHHRLLRELNNSCRMADITDALGGSTSEVQTCAYYALSSNWLKKELRLQHLSPSKYISIPHYLQQYARQQHLGVPLTTPEKEGEMFFSYLKTQWEQRIALQATGALFLLLSTTLSLVVLFGLSGII